MRFGHPCAALLSFALTLPAASAAKEEKPSWDVASPPGSPRTVTIDTRETTWSDVDVSPDGRTVVFDMLGDIYTVPIEGGAATAVTDGLPWNIQPRFSPDGERIAFISDRGGADNLWVMNADGSGARAITEEKDDLVHNPSWSPDGEYLVAKKSFMSTRSIPAGEIWLFHSGSSGGGLKLVARPHGDKDQKNIAEPAFSPDGRYVYYSQDVTSGRIWQYNKDATGQLHAIKRLELDTGKVDTFVDGPGGAIRPTPSPDGRYLAFVKRMPGLVSALYVKDLESGLEQAVYRGLDRDQQETFGSHGNTPAFAWTPDGESIVFWAGGKIRRVSARTHEATVIPVHVRTTRKIYPALRFPVDVAPDDVDVKMLRWAQVSPDGSRVVFQALGHLHVHDLKTGERRRLTRQDDHFELYPSFSPDGKHVVYVTWDDEVLGSVRIVSTSGGTSRKLTPQPGHFVEPRFSPDGRSIVYRKITGGYLLSGRWSLNAGIHVMPARGGESKRVSRTGFDARFDATGERVLFSESKDTHLLLKSVNLEGHDVREHLEGAKITEFSPSPDGRWVAFTEQFNVHVTPFPRTGAKVTLGSSAKAMPLRQVSKRAGEFLHWSGDSRSLHWSHGPTLYTRELRDAFSFLEGSPDELPEPAEEGVHLGFTVPADEPEGAIVLAGGRVVTMRHADERQEIIEGGNVVIRGNRIHAVGLLGPADWPEGATVIDVSGMTVLPGLIDVHAHGAHARDEITPQQNWMQYSNLSFGVTTIHDPSNDTSSIFAAAELQRTGAILAPRIFSTGTILYGAYVPGITAAIDDYDDALFHVRRMRDVGAISVKSYQQPRRDQRQQLVAAGRELGIMVVPEGGGKFQHNMNEIVDGHTGIEHCLPILRGYEDVEQLWSQSEAGYTPTLGVAFGGLSGEYYWYDRTDVWRNERLMSFVPRFVVEPRAMRRHKAPDDHYNHVPVAAFAKKLRDRGVSVQVGAHGQREGLATHWEMWMLEQGGFTPWEALRAGTIDGAHYVGLDGDVGSIEPDKLADLIVVEGNPLKNLRLSERVVYTVLNGRVHDAATMNQVAPERLERREFFFETVGGDTVHPETSQWLELNHQRFGCPH